MRDRRGRRRRSKVLWVREETSRTLHTMAMVITQARFEDGASARQEWLWDQIVVELAYRRSHAIGRNKCTCMICVPGDHLTRAARYQELWGWSDDEDVPGSLDLPERGEEAGPDHEEAPQTDQ